MLRSSELVRDGFLYIRHVPLSAIQKFSKEVFTWWAEAVRAPVLVRRSWSYAVWPQCQNDRNPQSGLWQQISTTYLLARANFSDTEN